MKQAAAVPQPALCPQSTLKNFSFLPESAFPLLLFVTEVLLDGCPLASPYNVNKPSLPCLFIAEAYPLEVLPGWVLSLFFFPILNLECRRSLFSDR